MTGDASNLDIRVHTSAATSSAEVEEVLRLFELCYRQADRDYVVRSLGTLRNLATARDGDLLVAFCLGETRLTEVPRLGVHTILLPGMCCIARAWRRRGLSGFLVSIAMGHEAPTMIGERALIGARMAHPASSRRVRREPWVVPKRGARPTRWQQEVGWAVARAYGATDFDPEHFVVRGTGVPIGYPDMEIEVEAAEEWELFERVNRDRGDALLTITWSPTAPPGWLL